LYHTKASHNTQKQSIYYKKMDLRYEIYKSVIDTLKCPMIVSSQVGGDDQLIFDGYSCAFNKEAKYIHLAKAFVEDAFLIDLEKYGVKSLLSCYGAGCGRVGGRVRRRNEVPKVQGQCKKGN